MAKRIEPRYECIAYLSVEADLNVVDRLEDKQLKYIKEYAGLSTLFQTNFFRLFFRYCTGV